MEMKYSSILVLIFSCFSLNMDQSLGGDTLSWNESLSIGQTIISSGGNFELGFFQPGNSLNYYIGIWYKKFFPQTVVWVANREKPVDHMSSPELKIIHGNLVLVDKHRNTIWSSTQPGDKNNSVVAVLRDDGNLILSDVSSSSGNLPIWESFDNPTDTFLPGSKIGYNKRTGRRHVFVSWKNWNDPAPGLYSLELDPRLPQFIVKWNRTTRYFKSGTWIGDGYLLPPDVWETYTNNENESYITYSILKNSTTTSRFTIDVSGQVKRLTWLNNVGWNNSWSGPGICEVYGYCGAFGVCSIIASSPVCNCLSGFVPRSVGEWNSNDFSGGCVRNGKLQCGPITEDKSSFWIYSTMGLPSTSHYTNATVMGASECRSTCFNNCACTGYSYDGLVTCSIWTGDLFNLEPREYERKVDISVKIGSLQVSAKTNAKNSTRLKVILSTITASMVLLICSLSCIYYRRRMEKRGEGGKGTQETRIFHRHKIEEEAKVLINKNKDEVIDVPYFHLETILAATDDFSMANKLGQGGFGPVYKGIFPDGREIAVKRLSSQSGQGIDEFMNEVTLIAKLQHRNLVKLLGYCINGSEVILLYEYMPNKSLDTFIFDGTLCQSLDWKQRYDIILGIARGLSYLHHDSRLRIIHRDFKTSNILLDEEMNPKISDFGLARIVEGKGTEANTKKVVGTFGYMSPEYALDGLFSIKSDVFSFGVVVLEIVSGRRNTGFYRSEEALNLLGHAWRLCIEGSEEQFIGKSFVESCNRDEVKKCINVALLCVQEDQNDRPNMSEVILMLGGIGVSLPRPNRPAFVVRTHTRFGKSYDASNNQVTITVLEGR